MLRNYLIIAYRNLLKNKVFSLINILGLAIGMSACLLILQYVSVELSYDNFHEKAEQVYRIRNDHFDNKGDFSHKRAITYGATTVTMKKEFPEVIEQARYFPTTAVIKYQNESGKILSFKEKKVAFVDPSFMDIFTFPQMSGLGEKILPGKLLQETNTIVLTQSMAQRYFGKGNPIGKVMTIFGQEQLTVKGVIQDVPTNSHIYFDCLVSYSTLLPEAALSLDSWDGDNVYGYVLLNRQADAAALEDKLPAMLEKYRGKSELDKFMLQPIKDIHLYSDLDYEAEVNGNGGTVQLLSIIALIIIAIAWINYINLATSRSIERAKEVGIRKVMGSARISIIKQFIFEALMLNFISAILALTLAQLSLPLINKFTGWNVEAISALEMLKSPVYGIKYPFLIIFLIGSLLSAIYPALVLSTYTPQQILKGIFKNSAQGVLLRKSLVVFQFAASIILIAGTLIAYHQLSFMLNQNLGVNIDQTIVVDAPSIHAQDSIYTQQLQVFKQELLQNPKIAGFSVSSDVPGKPIGSSRGGVRRVSVEEFVGNRYNIAWVDDSFFPDYDIAFLAGRNFSKNLRTDLQEGVILNESACQLIGFESPEAAIGQHIIVSWQDKKQVIGVIKDYHQHFLKADHDPVIYEYAKRSRNYFSLKIQASNMQDVIIQVKKKYEAAFPENPFHYFFLDTFYDHQYKADRQFLKIFGLFAGLAVLVACLGLFALSSFTIVQRQKEIGVRKVLGASALQVLQLLYKDICILILLANLIAWPLGYIGIRQWLQNYAFHVDITAWLLIIPSLIVLLIALLTISTLTIKAARANPVKSLRYE